jgi:hydrogenase/urease accessory protein HupE
LSGLARSSNASSTRVEKVRWTRRGLCGVTRRVQPLAAKHAFSFRKSPGIKTRPVILWLGLLLLSTGPSTFAHNAFENTAIARLLADRMEIRLTLALTTARTIDTDGADLPTDFDRSGIPALRQRLLARAGSLFEVTSHDSPLALSRAELVVDSEDEFTFLLIYPRPAPGPFRLRAAHMTKLPYGGTYLTIQGKAEEVLASTLLMADDLTLEALAPPPGALTKPPATPRFETFFRLGVKHIVTGYDHLLFLIGLLVMCRRGAVVAGIVTCFTLAHSVTLALAALGIFSLPGRIVEPLIAASIVFVGVENILRRDAPRGRWIVTFAFGLVHGFGFASVLREIGLGSAGAGVAVPLLAFNLGIELGQLAIGLIVFPLVWWVYRRPTSARTVPMIVSVLVTVAGVIWFLQRTIFA